MKVIGITGGLASGKSYILSVFAEIGAATQNSDTIVHGLIDTEAFAEISKQFPASVEAEKINRKKLREEVFADEKKLKILENILHPLVRKKNIEFISANQNKKIVALEIPLLFETGAERICDHTIFVDAPLQQRQERAQTRSQLSPEQFEQIAAKQMPPELKKQKADFIINNAAGADIKNQIQKILEKINA